MPNYRTIAANAAKANGVDPRIFLAQIQQESGFNPNARSGAGAIGIAQIVPKWHPGVDASDPVASLNYAAHWMGQLVRKYGNYQQALSVYNSGNPNAYRDPHFASGQTYNYVKTILANKTPSAPVAPGAAPPAPSPTLTPSPLPGAPGLPSAPAGNPLLAGLQGVSRQLGLTSLNFPNLAAPAPLAPSAGAGAAPPPLPMGQPSPPLVRKGAGKVILSPNADRAGVAIKPAVLNFVSSIAGLWGSPLTIGTGTNHNQYVVDTHRQSDHWTGWAADIPASGSNLTRLGQDALIAAGANPAWARAQKGGVYNIGGKQILFNTRVGGNHFNHLHVGLRTH